jgi:hypothetical protein
MKKGFILAIVLITMLANHSKFANDKKEFAQVQKIQGLMIFVKAKPVQDYEYLGSIKGKLIGSHEFDTMLETFIKNCKKEYPEANAILFDNKIGQTHNTKASDIKVKD